MEKVYLGTLLDTEEDIKRRKFLAINAANNLRRFFENSKLTINLKLKLINTYIEPIVLYNSEKWTLTKSMVESINAFQRRIVRIYYFNIKWPKTLCNQDLYERTKIVEWKKKVTVRRLKWFGKMARAPEQFILNLYIKKNKNKNKNRQSRSSCSRVVFRMVLLKDLKVLKIFSGKI